MLQQTESSLLNGIDVSAVGDVLVFSSSDAKALRTLVREILSEGGKVLCPPTRLGNKWIANISKPPTGDKAAVGA
jgi:hypothetical protein